MVKNYNCQCIERQYNFDIFCIGTGGMVAIARALKVNSTIVSVPITVLENELAEQSQF